MLSRRRFVLAATSAVGALPALAACSSRASSRYADAARDTWRLDERASQVGGDVQRELVRCATLAASSHNTQCWSFTRAADSITINPDLNRRCPAVDPADHHLFISLGCATENLVQAASAHGLHAEPIVDGGSGSTRVMLAPSPPLASALYRAIPSRQSTRGVYDGSSLSSADLRLLESAGTADGVRILLFTDAPAIERLLEQVVTANSAQRADEAFERELKQWIRFNPSDALRSRDGLFSGCTGNPSVPSWLGGILYDLANSPSRENDTYAKQIRSSAGLAVFVSDVSDKAHWIAVGRAFERFALQCTALDVRTAMLNQPIEVPRMRAALTTSLGLQGQHPDLLVRFGRGARATQSLRRDVRAVLA